MRTQEFGLIHCCSCGRIADDLAGSSCKQILMDDAWVSHYLLKLRFLLKLPLKTDDVAPPSFHALRAGFPLQRCLHAGNVAARSLPGLGNVSAGHAVDKVLPVLRVSLLVKR